MSNQFGSRLKELREERELSQEQLAALLGTSKQVISRYETGQRMPKVDTVMQYAVKLQVSIEKLTGYERDTPDLRTEQEQRLLEAFRAVSPETQDFILASLMAHQKERQDKKR